MSRTCKVLSAVIMTVFLSQSVWAEKKAALSPEDQKQYDAHMQAAKDKEFNGYLLAGVAIGLVVIAIPLNLFLNKRKKAKQ